MVCIVSIVTDSYLFNWIYDVPIKQELFIENSVTYHHLHALRRIITVTPTAIYNKLLKLPIPLMQKNAYSNM